MRVPIAATRIGLAVAAMVAGLVGAALASGAFLRSDGDASPTPEPETASSAQWWEDARHPPRTASVSARVGLEKSAGAPVRVDVDYEVVLQADDPLLALVTRGEVTGLELVGRLVGGRLDDYGRPTVQRDGTGPARVRVGGRILPDQWSESTNRAHVPIPLEVGFKEDNAYTPAPTSVVTRRSLTVEVTGMKIVAVSGAEVVRQSPTMVRLEGPPGSAEVSVEVENSDFNGAARS